jgi:CofD-related protein of GAK system
MDFMTQVRVCRNAQIPDPLRISRYAKSPELGPRVLFFSGGSALTGLSRRLKYHTHNSTHLVTPFDSGGSSAKLRAAFRMPSIGDLRSRLMALADETVTGHPDIYRLFTYRFPADAENSVLAGRLDEMIAGKDELVAPISNPMRRLIRNQLGFFRDEMPDDFDLRGASIGNLTLAGGYLNNHQHLDPIIFLVSKLVGVLGTVRAVTNENLHLAAELTDGSLVVGQHRLTGKEQPPLELPIKRLFLSSRLEKATPVSARLRKKNRKLIERAELICFPMGSFYSSLLANLLPEGVGTAVAVNSCPKVFIPNLAGDPEQIGMSLDDALRTLLKQLRSDAGSDCPANKLLNFVLLDSRNSDLAPPSVQLAQKLGITVIDTRLVTKKCAPYYDPELLVAALLSLT